MRQSTTVSRVFHGAVIALPLLVLAGGASAGTQQLVNSGYFGSVAILGYDPVAYFTDSKATKGSPQISERWLGATWYFASTKHRDVFMSEPIRYAPQYGGFCTGGMAFEEASANIDPESWRIVDGKLYLFSGKEGVAEEFDPVSAEIIGKADANWSEIRAKEIDDRSKTD
jgi:YHS domain-containing protein